MGAGYIIVNGNLEIGAHVGRHISFDNKSRPVKFEFFVRKTFFLHACACFDLPSNISTMGLVEGICYIYFIIHPRTGCKQDK